MLPKTCTCALLVHAGDNGLRDALQLLLPVLELVHLRQLQGITDAHMSWWA